MEFVFLDEAVAVVVKPPGCVAEDAGPDSLPGRTAAALAERGEQSEVFTVHRLDKPVGGLMVLARTHAAASALIAQIADRRVEKEYLAVLRGSPAADEAVLEDLLFHDSRTNKTFVVRRERRGVRPAKLQYRVLARLGGLTLVRVKLFTGRTHQIRAQFAARGLPLLGDLRYGSKDPRCDVSLWSCHLRFLHPVTGKPMDFELPPPNDYPWTLFSDQKK